MRRFITFATIASFILSGCGDIEEEYVEPAPIENSHDIRSGSNYDNSFYTAGSCKDVDQYKFSYSTSDWGRPPIKFMNYGGFSIPFRAAKRLVGPQRLQELAREGLPSKSLSKEYPIISSKLNYENFALQHWIASSEENYGAIYIEGVDVKVTDGPHFKNWTKRVDIYFRDGWGNYEQDLVGSWHEDTGWRYNKCLNVAKYFDGKGKDHVFLKVWLKEIPKEKVRVEPRIHAELFYN